MKTATSLASTPTRAGILLILALVMLATRTNHFSALPDASWAVFFVAGFYLRGSARWVFPLLMAFAVLIDFFVISGQGVDFWSHYCVSIAYWFLLPSYAAMWLGGSLMRKYYAGLHTRELGLLIASVVVATSACYLISNGSFYWLSQSWINANANAPLRSLGGWIKNLGDWYLPYLRTTLMYVGVATVLHVATGFAAKSLTGGAQAALPRKR
jgi:hypothetical protein